MNAFDFAGIFFLLIGGIQSLGILWVLLLSANWRKNPGMYLFLFMGILFIVCGIWMMTFQNSPDL